MNGHMDGKKGYIMGVGFLTEPNLNGIFHVFQGQGEFDIEIRGFLTPVALMVESYH